jgi:hypothetical protein
MTAGSGIAGSQDFILGAETQFRLSRDMRMVVVREILGVAHTTCWSGSSSVWCISIQVITTLSDMSDRLSVAVIS